MTRSVAFLVALLAIPAGAGTAETPATMKYFVSGRQKDPVDPVQQKAREKELKDARSLAEKSQDQLVKQLETQHGKALAAWPAAARQQYEEAGRKVSDASREHAMLATEQKEIDESAADLKRSFQKLAEKSRDGRIQLVANRDEANVAVEVVARRATTPSVVLYLKVTPLKWLPPAQLAEVPFKRAGDTNGYLSFMEPEKSYDEQAPYWVVSVWEFVVGGGRWKGVADTATELLAETALGHLDIFRHKDPEPEKGS